MTSIEENPTVNNASTAKGIEIVRIAPRNQGVDVEFRCSGKYNPYIRLTVCELKSGKKICESDVFSTSRIFSIGGLLNEVDYIAEVTAFDYDGKELERSNKRLFRTGYFPGHVINYIHPDDLTYAYSGRFIGTPNIIRLENGTYIASHDVFDTTGHGSLCLFFVSKDYGKTWNYISRIEKCTWGNLFVRGGRVYMYGISDCNDGDLVIYCSDDDCVSWSKPTTLFRHKKEFAVRSSPTPFAEYNGRLWFYFNNYTYDDKAGFQTAVASIAADADFMDAKNWAFTPFIKFDAAWEGTAGEAWGPYMVEKGNMLINRDNELVMMLRYNSHRYDIPESNPAQIKSIILKVDTENPSAPLTFKKIIPFNGTFSKFYIRYDEKTDLYYAMLNRMTTNKIWQRNVLSLYSSYDLENWKVERDLINLEDAEWCESNWDSAVQYPTWLIEGEDIIAAARAAADPRARSATDWRARRSITAADTLKCAALCR